MSMASTPEDSEAEAERASVLDADALSAVLRLLTLRAQLRVSAVCRTWREGAMLHFAHERNLDVRTGGAAIAGPYGVPGGAGRQRDACYTNLLTDAALSRLVAHRPRLEALLLMQCARLTDDGLAALHGCACLRRLNLAMCTGVTERGVAALIDALPALDDLELAGCSRVRLDVPALSAKFERFVELSEDADGLDAVQG